MKESTEILSRALGLPLPAMGPAAFHVIWGPREISLWALEAVCPLLQGSARVLWVDAANRFDAHGLAKAAVAFGMDPREALRRVEVARPFNAFQLAAMVAERIPRRGPVPLVLADPLALFYDDELPAEDARTVFQRFRQAVAALPGPTAALLVEREAPLGRRDFAGRLAERAGSVVRLLPRRR